MIKRIFVYIIFLSVISPVYLAATCNFNKGSESLDYQPRLSGELYRFFYRPLGSYYLYNNWTKGDVLLISGEKVKDEYLKYNSYLDELIWLSSKTFQPVKVDKKLVKEFYLNLPGERQPLIFRNITINVAFRAEPLNIFAHKLYDGNISLFVHRRMTSTGEMFTGPEGTFPRLEADPVFYILKADNIAYEVSRFNRRALYRVFPEYRSEIRRIFRRENIFIRSENDLIRAVVLIDKMLSE